MPTVVRDGDFEFVVHTRRSPTSRPMFMSTSVGVGKGCDWLSTAGDSWKSLQQARGQLFSRYIVVMPSRYVKSGIGFTGGELPCQR